MTVFAAPCDECIKITTSLDKELSLKQSYIQLKARNEDYLKKPDIPSGAAIKVRSNLMLLGIKIETQDNKIEALKLQKKKLNDCVSCQPKS